MQSNQTNLLNQFLELSYNSMKWKKWMLKDTNASDYDRSIIAGHYVFSSSECIDIKNQAKNKIANLDELLKNEVKLSIERYINAFNLSASNA